TAHAELNAIREGCAHLGHVHLTGAIVAATCEPCPMCMAALHAARVDTIYFGASSADATAAGFNALAIGAEEMIRLANSPMQLIPGILTHECVALFDEWHATRKTRTY